MDLGVDVDVKVEDDSLQVDEHDVRNVLQEAPLSDGALFVAKLALPVVDDLSLVVVLQSFGKVVPILDTYLVTEEELIPLLLLPTRVADHLDRSCPLEETVEEFLIWGRFNVFLEVVEEEVEELGGVLLDHWVDGGVEGGEDLLGDEVLSFREEEVGVESLHLLLGLGGRAVGHQETVPERLDDVEHLEHRIHVTGAAEVVKPHSQGFQAGLADL